MSKPANATEFTEWSTEATCGVFDRKVKAWYELNKSHIYATCIEHKFFAELAAFSAEATREYKSQTDSELFGFGRMPSVDKFDWNRKSYDSFVEKLYRINCLENKNFPDPPDQGWCSLDNCLERVDDVVRTILVVTYADAPKFLSDFLARRADELQLAYSIKDHTKEKGYYAHHLYVNLSVSTSSIRGEMTEISVPVEIQITTELQGILRGITHKLYEAERLSPEVNSNWKNQFESGRFRAAYMAHSLRFIEAMIVELRDKVSKKRTDQ